MDGLLICVFILLGTVSPVVSGSETEETVRAGDNITLYCDCRNTSGRLIVWFRNCSHQNQPALVLKLNLDAWKISSDVVGLMSPLPRFQFVANQSSESTDLLITNITDSDEGLYYCGNEMTTVGGKEKITAGHDYELGNRTTRIIVDSSRPPQTETPPGCDECWMLMFFMCPACAVLSSLLSSIVVYQCCQDTAGEDKAEKKSTETRRETQRNQDEDVSYAALEIRPASQKPERKKAQHPEFSTYSAVMYREGGHKQNKPQSSHSTYYNGTMSHCPECTPRLTR